MSFVPNTPADQAKMLQAIGAHSMDDLFQDVPAGVRYPRLNLPEPLSEPEIMAELESLTSHNADATGYACFLGAGSYRHFIPAVVNHVIGRGEFYTAYTPYQAEISQGTLQSIFEYQSMICALTGMDVANASHYDGATAIAEAAIMAHNATRGRKKIIISPAVHPEYRQVLRTYTQGLDISIVGDSSIENGWESLAHMIDADTACVIAQVPDFLGRIYDLAEVAAAAHKAGALFIVSANPISLGLLKPPADYGADIVTGEGQSLGWPMDFGGPYLGLFACREQYVRRMAGRLVGQTVDGQGRRGFVLTLQTREQHIRREKATSNICTNEGLAALAACVYLAALGKTGLKKVAELCYHKAHYAAGEIARIPGYSLPFAASPFFNEFVVHCPIASERINDTLRRRKIIGGYDLGQAYPELKDCMLFCVTELNSKYQIDQLAAGLSEAIA
jgi:glycine dehydrogenase subunit 1